MLNSKKTPRARLGLESLEAREVCAANLGHALAGLPPAALAHQANLLARQEMPVVPLAPPAAAQQQQRANAGDAGAQAVSPFVYTAVTIRNDTNITVNYSFRWNGGWARYSLAAGRSRVHYISALNQKATISYDKSFSPGVQEQRYSLAGRNIRRSPGFYLVEPVPGVREGKLYTFGRVSGGVQLYSA